MRIRTFFPDFKLCRPAISKPVVLEKSDIPQKKALNSGNWKQYWNWKDFCHGRLQTGFSKSDAFSVRWAWPSLRWCHAQFFSWFKELYIRAFQWYIICFRILVGTCSKLQKHMNKNLPRWFHSILAVCPVVPGFTPGVTPWAMAMAGWMIISQAWCPMSVKKW